MLKYVVRRLINYVVLLFIAVSFAYVLASYALDPRNAFDQTNPKLNWTAINQSLTNYNINPDTSIWVRYERWLKMVFLHWNWGWTPHGDAINSLYWHPHRCVGSSSDLPNDYRHDRQCCDWCLVGGAPIFGC